MIRRLAFRTVTQHRRRGERHCDDGHAREVTGREDDGLCRPPVARSAIAGKLQTRRSDGGTRERADVSQPCADTAEARPLADFVCECASETCLGVVSITLAEWDAATTQSDDTYSIPSSSLSMQPQTNKPSS